MNRIGLLTVAAALALWAGVVRAGVEEELPRVYLPAQVCPTGTPDVQATRWFILAEHYEGRMTAISDERATEQPAATNEALRSAYYFNAAEESYATGTASAATSQARLATSESGRAEAEGNAAFYFCGWQECLGLPCDYNATATPTGP